jgi:hypothetical protein
MIFNQADDALIRLAELNPEQSEDILSVAYWLSDLHEVFGWGHNSSVAEMEAAFLRAEAARRWLLQAAPIGTRLH